MSAELQYEKLPSLSTFRIRWVSVIIFSALHLSLIVGLWHFSWSAFLVGLLGAYLSGFIGISVGYHRYLAHRSFEMTGFMKFIHLLLAGIGMQLGPITWVRTHKIHHAKADTIEDPHTQIYGFLWGLCGWIFLSHPRIGRSNMTKRLEMRDLYADPMVLFFERNWFNLFLLSLAMLYYFGGLPWLIWAGCFRVLYLSYFIWLLNVSGHGWGQRRFSSPDRSTNSLLIALLSGGEGWHNNHHYFPFSARFGLTSKEIDTGYLWIKLMVSLGLAWNVKTPAQSAPPAIGPSLPTSAADLASESR